MTNQQPAYKIYNFQLAQFPNWINDPITSPAYLVFWHNGKALGNLWVLENEKTDPATLARRIRFSVEDTLQYYALHANHPTKSLRGLWQNTKTDVWQEVLNSVVPAINSALPETLPVSVVICTRHRPVDLERCLTSLRQLPCKPQQIVVVDNGPDRPETKQVAADFTEVDYVAEPKPGLDIARNTGIRASNQPIIAYLDDDVEVHPNWVYAVWQAFQNNENIGAITGLVLANKLDTPAQAIFEKYWSFNRGYVPKLYSPTFIEFNLKHGPPVWNIGAGANMAFKREALRASGLFDERLDAGAAGCNGDSEMWFRILKAEYSILYQPQAIVWHTHRESMPGLRSQIKAYMQGHVVACLIQEEHTPEAKYRPHINRMLKHYAKGIKWGFPKYENKFSTLKQEFLGVMGGFRYYKEHKNACGPQPPKL
jgi:glycosyltransferase involved in cell wall biosynthesis